MGSSVSELLARVPDILINNVPDLTTFGKKLRFKRLLGRGWERRNGWSEGLKRCKTGEN